MTSDPKGAGAKAPEQTARRDVETQLRDLRLAGVDLSDRDEIVSGLFFMLMHWRERALRAEETLASNLDKGPE